MKGNAHKYPPTENICNRENKLTDTVKFFKHMF